jgi:hypothetical protein
MVSPSKGPTFSVHFCIYVCVFCCSAELDPIFTEKTKRFNQTIEKRCVLIYSLTPAKSTLCNCNALSFSMC